MSSSASLRMQSECPISVEITQQEIIKSMIESQGRIKICDEELLEKFHHLNIEIVKNYAFRMNVIIIYKF